MYVFGTNAGADHHPAWVHNVRANPRVTVERGAEKFQATAVSLDGEERDHVYAEQAAQDPAFAAYQEGTSRRIPVVALTPVSGLGDQLVRIHDGLRRELAVLVAEAADQADRTALTARFREHCRAYCGNVHEHHINEATRGFPLLLRAFPELAPALETLRAEHDRLAELRAELEKTLDQTDAVRLHADLSRLSAELNAHFDREESQLVRALNAL